MSRALANMRTPTDTERRQWNPQPCPETEAREKAALLHTLHCAINAVTEDRANVVDVYLGAAVTELARWNACRAGYEGAAG